MPPSTASTPDTPPAPATASALALAVVTEAVQRIEADGPLDDAAALRQACASAPTRAAQVQARAWLLGQRLGLPAELARWRRVGWAVVAALALLMAATGLGLARAVLGQGRSINAVAAFVSLLGPHLVMLALWLGALLLSGARWAGPLLGRAALWLSARLPIERGPHALVLLQSFSAVLQRRGLLGWLTGAVSHGIWTLAFAITLAVLAFGFAFHAYTLTWETTILSGAFFQRFMQLTGALPALLGFAVPDAAAVQGVGNAAAGLATGVTTGATTGLTTGAPVPLASQREWAWWLMGCVLAYGLLPRALLAGLSLLRWRAGLRRLAGAVDLADPGVRRIVARLDALAPPPQVIDPEQRPPSNAAAIGMATAAPGQPGTLAVLGFELPPEQAWPVPGLAAGAPAAERLSGSAAEREATLARLARQRPEALLVVLNAAASPDRGTARFLREALPLASRSAVLLLAPQAAVGALAEAAWQRWRGWLDSEGFSDLAGLHTAQQAMNWIANEPSQGAMAGEGA